MGPHSRGNDRRGDSRYRGGSGRKERHVSHRRKNRHGAGLQRGTEREVQRKDSFGTLAGPFLVHCLRTRGPAAHRVGSHRRKRRLGCQRGSAHRAQGVGCLPAGRRRQAEAAGAGEPGLAGTQASDTRRPGPGAEARHDTNPAARSEGRLMIYEEVTTGSRTRRTLTGAARVLFALKLDGPLIIGLALVAVYGLIILYSASGQSTITIYRTLGRLALGTAAMLVLAQVNPNFLRRTAPWLYAFGMLLLFIVYGVGHIGKGAQRWLDLGFIRFQPSELMKLAVPMTVAWFLHERALPPGYPTLLLLTGMIL